MTTIERRDLVNAVLQSRDDLDPGLDTAFLEAVVNAEADAAGDGDAAIRAIDAAVMAAIARGVGHAEPVESGGAQDDEDEENAN